MSDGMSDGKNYGPMLSKHAAPIISDRGRPVKGHPFCTIVINGKKVDVPWDDDSLSFEDLTRMAEMPDADTVTYSGIAHLKSAGTLLPGEWLMVRNGSIINVSKTNKA